MKTKIKIKDAINNNIVNDTDNVVISFKEYLRLMRIAGAFKGFLEGLLLNEVPNHIKEMANLFLRQYYEH